ncbi:hypothetical protein [Actinomadura violacea]|uniref:Uncharacterized protein n=1 Tax=Actinomadura violacea TaxID=2819934 RepID=A0ABS3S8D2_9ACTN|nr:hypothetical protein [Actinomadura violacea]MBO2464499.1 hypothetical protein [Actinomadura violacea]
MRAAHSPFRTIRTAQINDPAYLARLFTIAEYGGRVLWDPVYKTHFCLACLKDVPADHIHEGISTCCLA